jgi:PAS domain S-box-containing protein
MSTIEPIRVLIVDNEVDAREWLAEWLRLAHRFEVDTVNDGVEAIARVQGAAGNYDTILMDLQLGGGPDGLETMKTIQAEYPDIQVVIMTGFGGVDDGVRAMKEGAYSYVFKPLNRDEIVVYIHSAAERRRLKKERDWLQSLLKASEAVSSSLELTTVLPKIVELAGKVSGSDHTGVVLVGANGELATSLEDHEVGASLHIRARVSGITRRIIATGEPVNFNEVQDDGKTHNPVLIEKGFKSYLGVPITVGGKVRGVLFVHSFVPYAFGGQIPLLTTFANQAAIAIENARLHEETTYRLHVLSSLYETLTALRTSLDFEQVLNLVVDHLQELFALDTCTVGLFDAERTRLDFVAERGLGQRVTRLVRDLPSDLIEHVLTFDEPIVISDLDARPDLRRALVRPGLKSFIVLPLLGREKPLGLVTMGSVGEITLLPEQKELLKALANQAAIAIENARLHQQTKQRGEQLAALDQTALDIAKRLEAKELLRAIVKRATELVQGTGGGVYLFSEADETFRSEAVYGLPPELEGTQIEKDQGVIGRIFQTRQPITVVDYQHWSGRLRILDEFKLTAVVGVPIMSGDCFFGVIAVHDTKEGRVFGEAEQELLRLFGNHVAVTLENARAYTAVQEATAYLDHLISSSLDGVIAIDEDGWISVFNEGAERILGYSHNEVLNQGKQVHELYGSVEIAREIKRQLISKEKLENYETTVLAKDGQTVPILLSATLLRGREGKTLGSVGFFKDLRPLKKAEAELRLLLDTVNTVASTRSVDEGLNTLAEKMVTGLTTTFCHIMLLNDTGQNLMVKAAYPIPRPQSGGLKWKPEVGKLVRLSPMEHLLTMPGPRVFQKGEIVEGQNIVSHIREIVKLEGSLESALVIPLEVGGKTLGICTLGEMRDWKRSPFTKDKISLASSMATQAVVAVEKAQGYELALERAKALHRLNEVGDAIASILELDKVLNLIVGYGAQLLHAEVCSVFLVRREGYLSLEAGYGSPLGSFRRGLELEIKSSRGTGLTGHIAKVGELVNLHGEELLNHPAVRQPGPHDHLPSGYCTSLLAIPLKRKLGEKREVIGLIKAENKKDSTGKADPALSFSNEDILILKTLANHATTAIANAQLFGLTNTLQEVAKIVSSTLDLDEVLQRILVELGSVVPYTTASIQLLTGEGLKIAACEGFDEGDKKKVLRLTFPLDPKFPNYRVVMEKTPFLLPDIRSSRYHHFWEEADTYYSDHIQAWLGVPLLHGDEIIGMISIDSSAPWRYTIMDIDVATAFVSQVVSAIVNAKLYRSAQGLFVTMLDITKESDLEAVLKRIVDNAVSKEGIGADIAIIYPYDPDSEQVSRPVYAGTLRHPEEVNPPLSAESVVYRLLKFRAPYVASHADGDHILDRAFVDREGVKSSAGFPLLVDEEPVGVMFVNFISPHTFITPEVGLINLFAQQAAIAIQNARRYESISQRFKAAELMAWLGPLSSTWSHRLGGTTFNVLTDIASLRRYLALEVSIAHRSELQKILSRLESNAAVLTTIVPSLPTEDIEESVDINTVLDDLLRDLPARYPHIQVVRHCAELPPVRANRRGLTFVFEELTSNAVRQMPKGGRLTFIGSVMGRQAVIEVTDTGPGIPDEKIRSQIFEKRHVVGAQDTGFGLSLVETALAMYNGDIELSNWENGCTFVMRLPLA